MFMLYNIDATNEVFFCFNLPSLEFRETSGTTWRSQSVKNCDFWVSSARPGRPKASLKFAWSERAATGWIWNNNDRGIIIIADISVERYLARKKRLKLRFRVFDILREFSQNVFFCLVVWPNPELLLNVLKRDLRLLNTALVTPDMPQGSLFHGKILDQIS